MKCKRPLSAGPETPSERSGYDSITVSENWQVTLPYKYVGFGVAAFFLLGLVYVLTKPKDTTKLATAQEVQSQIQASQQPPERQIVGIEGMTTEELGVRPLDLEIPKSAAIKKLGDGEYTDPVYNAVGVHADDPQGTLMGWTTVEVPGSRRKLCSRTIFGAKARVRYDKDEENITAVATVAVDQECGESSGKGVGIYASWPARSTLTSDRLYVWKHQGHGIYEWEYAPLYVLEKERKAQAKSAAEESEKFRADQKKKEEKRKAFLERMKLKSANQNSSH